MDDLINSNSASQVQTYERLLSTVAATNTLSTNHFSALANEISK